MDFTGTIHKICDTVHIKETFKKRDVVIESSETKGDKTYTELITFQFIQDKVDLLDGFKVGDEVSLGFNLKGRKWTSPQGEDRYFNTLQSWMIRLLEEGSLPTPQFVKDAVAPSPSKMAELPKQDPPTLTEVMESEEAPF